MPAGAHGVRLVPHTLQHSTCALQLPPAVHRGPLLLSLLTDPILSCFPLPVPTGPPPLMTAVHLAAARLNGGACSGGAEGAYLELHKEAVEL